MQQQRNRTGHRVGALAIALTLVLAASVEAGNGRGRGNGNDGGGSPDNGILPVTIQFRSAGDSISGDDKGAYVHGDGGVEAFIGSQANVGNIWLRTVQAPGRGLWLDFSQCVSADASECRPLFQAEVNGRSSIKVDADAVLTNGILDMAIGAIIHPPMRVYYEDSTGQIRFVDFTNNAKGSSPCRNVGVVNVEVERTGDISWTVRAPGKISPDRPTACANSPLREDRFQGLYEMSFEFTVEQNP